MIRSMILAVALAGAVGCVAQDGTDEAAVSQQNGGSGLFDCQNNHSISGVQCVGDISILNGLSVNVKDVRALDGNEINVLSGDLNNVKVLDGNILDYNKILNDVEVNTLNDFLNKFNIDTNVSKIDVCALVGVLQICK
jgi:hypothetical protein